MVAVTVILSMAVILLLFNVTATPKPLYAAFDVKALNVTTLKVTSIGGNQLPQESTSVLVNGVRYDVAGLDDRNGNRYWDNGETLLIGGLHLDSKFSVSVVSGDTILLSVDFEGFHPAVTPSPVPWSSNWTLPVPPPHGPPPIPAPPTPPATYASDLVATYYDNPDWTNQIAMANTPEIRFANLEASNADPLLGSTREYNWPMTEIGRNASFSVKFEGYVLIDHDDFYTFYMRSDDGAYMELDGAYVISNENIGYDAENIWYGHLSSGYHRIRVYMYQGTGKTVVHLQYSTTTMSKQFVSQLYH